MPKSTAAAETADATTEAAEQTTNEQAEQTAATVDTTPTAADNAGKTFTQADLDATIKRRLNQERAKYSDYDDLKARLVQLESDLQAERDRAKNLTDQNSQLSTTAQSVANEAAIVAAASKIGLDGDAAVRLADKAKFVIGDDGKLTNAADIAKAIADAYPGLTRKVIPIGGAVNGQANEQSITPEMREAQQRREYFGHAPASFWTAGGVRMPTNEG